MPNQPSGGRIGAAFFPRLIGYGGATTLALWALATWGAIKPTQVVETQNVIEHVENLNIYENAPDPSPAPARRPAPQVSIEVAPANVIVVGDNAETAGVVQKELEARQAMVSAFSDDLARELEANPTALQQVSRVGPSDGLWVSDCEDDPEFMPLAEKTRFRSVDAAATARQRRWSAYLNRLNRPN